MTEWVRTNEHDGFWMESLGGILWAAAPLPPRWHRCKTQTRGTLGLNYYERCACGATRFNGGPWMEKNETRKHRRQRLTRRQPA